MKELSLYIHIPFCVKKCNYCDFLSFSTDLSAREKYVNALINEITKSGLEDYLVETIFFGGGTPSILEVSQINKILVTIRKAFNVSNNAEITIECNPKTVDYDKLHAYKEMGINRVSFGLQSTNDNELKVLGRIHSFSDFCSNYESARKAGISNINIDIMTALPYQTLNSYEETLKKVVSLNPEHISAYSLIIEEGTKFYENSEIINNLPDINVDRKMYAITKEMLGFKEYSRYEISNYAKVGFMCRHNLCYWQQKEYLGFGLGAASFFNGVRYKNESDIKEYLNNCSDLSTLRYTEEIVDKKASMEEFMFLGLRLMEGISITDFSNKFSVDIYQVYGKIIEKYVNMKLLIRENDRLFLSDDGIDVSNSILCDFLLD